MKDLFKQHHKEIQKLIDQYGITYLALFGSRSRGDFDRGSDFDMLVDYKNPIGIHGLADVQASLQSILNTKVDLVSRRGVKQAFLEEINKDIFILYDKKN